MRSSQNNGFTVIDLLILGAIALFVLGRLYMALGKDNGPPDGRPRGQAEPEPVRRDGSRETVSGGANQAPLGGTGRPLFTGQAAGGLEEIHNADSSFNPREFVTGAKAAYSMIVNAFAEGDKVALEPLLDPDVFEAWSAVIDGRSEDGPQPPTLLRLKSAEIEEAELIDGVASVDVQFEAELGDGDRVRNVREIWTFEKPAVSEDPNWKLSAVSTPE